MPTAQHLPARQLIGVAGCCRDRSELGQHAKNDNLGAMSASRLISEVQDEAFGVYEFMT
jgi:hypothetical protein